MDRGTLYSKGGSINSRSIPLSCSGRHLLQVPTITVNMKSISSSRRFTVLRPSPEVQAQFSSVPWALELFQDPALVPFVIGSRRTYNSTTAGTMCGKTLVTDDTIAAWQSFYKDPTSEEGRGEVWSLLKLGSGVNGHIDTCHGGFLSLVLDETLGNVAEHEKPDNGSTMTAYLNVDYKKPVPTPGCILVKAWLEKREGKKIWATGVIEDGQGNVSTIGNALFIIVHTATPRAKV
jgi:thioesterase superfamily protein 4